MKTALHIFLNMVCFGRKVYATIREEKKVHNKLSHNIANTVKLVCSSFPKNNEEVNLSTSWRVNDSLFTKEDTLSRPVGVSTCRLVDLSACRSVGMSTCRRVDLSTCRHVDMYNTCRPVGVSTCRRVDLSACRPVDMHTCLPVGVSACRSFCLSTCRRVDLSTCRRVHLPACRHVYLSACRPVGLSTCRCVDLSVFRPVNVSTSRYVDPSLHRIVKLLCCINQVELLLALLPHFPYLSTLAIYIYVTAQVNVVIINYFLLVSY